MVAGRYLECQRGAIFITALPRDSIEQFAKDCAGLMEHLKIAHCHAVGFALGGQIAQALAIQRPDLVATVTVAAAGAGTKATDGGPRIVRNTDEEEFRASL